MSFIAFWQDKVPLIMFSLQPCLWKLWLTINPCCLSRICQYESVRLRAKFQYYDTLKCHIIRKGPLCHQLPLLREETFELCLPLIVGAIPFSICFELSVTCFMDNTLSTFNWSIKDKIELISYARKHSATQWDNSRAACPNHLLQTSCRHGSLKWVG